jgi:hypothetical protein
MGSESWLRRILRFDGEVFLFGTAISAPVSYLLAMDDDKFSHPFIPRPYQPQTEAARRITSESAPIPILAIVASGARAWHQGI